jgi:23S rRNA (cytosine1962-C5)-methyltransferase
LDSLSSLLVPFRPERILARGEGILVVDKPPGLVVHGGDERLPGDLVSRLSALLRAEGHDGYLGVHSRLDVGTSGVLPLTTERDVNARVAAEIEQGEAERVYVAAVSLGKGCRLSADGRLEHRLLADKRRSQVVKSGGDLAVTHYRLLEERGARALVELRPETGRMHQLRVQLADCRAPIAGDELYGGAAAWRLLLHCRLRRVLGRPHAAPLPEELRTWLIGGSSFAPLVGFEGRLLDAASRRWPLLAAGSVFRLVNDQGDGLPGVTVDRYDDWVVLSVTSTEAEAQAQAMADSLVARGARGVYLKWRERRDLRRAEVGQLAPVEPIAGEPASSPLLVSEGSLKVRCELGDGLSTGLFIDQRDNRRRVLELAQGKQVLNLFSYTCSFSVAAALGGASKVTSVDLSGRALERGRVNFAANGLDPTAHEFTQTDAARFVRGALKHGRRFALIVLDPPSFASVGRATWRFERDIQPVMGDCLKLLTPDGALLCVTNHKQTNLGAFRRHVQAAAERAKVRIKLRDLPSGLDCPDALDGPHPSKSLLASIVVSEGRGEESR